MRTSTLARAGAVLTASALALSLGTGPVSAAESQTASGRVADSVPAVRDLGSASGITVAGTITALRLGSGVITQRATTQFVGTVAGTAPDNVQTDVRINGAFKGRVILYPGSGNGGVEIPRQWGSGKVQVGPTYFSDGSVAPAVSNTFYARKLVTTTRRDGYALKINRRNSKMTFKAREVKVINPSNGQFQSVKRVKLQQYKGGKWKSIKTIKLNRSGNGTYKTSIRKKYRYRLYSTRTSTQEKFSTIRTKSI